MAPERKHIIISNFDDIHNPHFGGGGATAIHEMAKRLAEDYRITVITGRYRGSRDETVDGVEYRRIGIAALGSKAGQLYFSLILPYYVMTLDYDLWVENFTPPVSTAFLPLFTKKPVIGMAHLLGGEAMTKLYKLPFDRVERIGLRTYSQFIVLSDETADKIKKANPKSYVSVIPNGVPQRYIDYPVTDDRRHILYIGRIAYAEKGLDKLLDAYQRIAPDIDAPLVIAGTGSLRDMTMLDRQILELGLSHKVKLVGKVCGEQKEKLLSQAYVVALPSLFETFPLTVLEAAAFAAPVVSFDIDGLKWVPESFALKAAAFDTDEYAQYLLEIVTNQKRRRQMGKAAKEFVQEYSWKAAADSYQASFEHAMGAEVSKSKVPVLRHRIQTTPTR